MALLKAQVCAAPAPAAEVQDITPALAMVVHGSITPGPAMLVQDSIAPAPAIVVHNTTPALEHAPLHIDEPKAKAYLGISSDAERIKGWYLDTGATTGTVKLGDGSFVDIRGIGTIIFTGKNGEHKASAAIWIGKVVSLFGLGVKGIKFYVSLRAMTMPLGGGMRDMCISISTHLRRWDALHDTWAAMAASCGVAL